MGDILVVGGAGYIGSHMCKYLDQQGLNPVVLDNLSYGHRQAVKWGPLYEGSVNDTTLLKNIFEHHHIDAVMHFAAFCYVGESVSDPARYYENNVSATLNLLTAMLNAKVTRFIFSSTCATYGEPEQLPIKEDHPQQPVNPYGWSKFMVERILQDFDHAYGLKSVCLRYFNAAGADPDGMLGEDHNPETHLIPLVLQAALGIRDHIKIFGTDYPTPDGTCIRDYIHITDLAQAHYRALRNLMEDGPSNAYNLGNGRGFSVREIIEQARAVTGRDIEVREADRRPGDPATLIGDAEKARKELGWQPVYDQLETIISTAWRWHRDNPEGFN